MSKLKKYLIYTVVTVIALSDSVPSCLGGSILFGRDDSQSAMSLSSERTGRIRGGGGISSSASPLHCDCRRRRYTHPRHSRIIHGKPASEGQFPWQARIEEFNFNGKQTWDYICGGVLISPFHILTASHCLSKEKSKYRVVLGSVDLHNRTGARRYAVSDYVLHRGDPLSISLVNEHDIALITIEDELGQGVTCDRDLQPICLDGPDFSPQTQCFISGWGEYKKDTVSQYLRYATVPIQPSQVCNDIYNQPNVGQFEPGSNYLRSMSGLLRYSYFTSDSMVCAGSKDGPDTCLGDSGGPLACIDDQNFAYLTGIISWGKSCGSQPSVYTKVLKYKEWIKENQFLSKPMSKTHSTNRFYR